MSKEEQATSAPLNALYGISDERANIIRSCIERTAHHFIGGGTYVEIVEKLSEFVGEVTVTESFYLAFHLGQMLQGATQRQDNAVEEIVKALTGSIGVRRNDKSDNAPKTDFR